MLSNQLNFFEKTKRIKQLMICGYGNVHEKAVVHMGEGTTIVVPRQFNEYPIEAGMDFDDYMDPDGGFEQSRAMYYKNFINAIQILRGDMDFEELDDLSFFASEKRMAIEGIYEKEEYGLKTVEGLTRIKKYRGKEWLKKMVTVKDKLKWKKLDGIQDYRAQSNETLKIAVYPTDLKTTLSRFVCTKNLAYLKEAYPEINELAFVDCFNGFMEAHEMYYSIQGDFDNLTIAKYMSEPDLESNLLELGLIYALECQLQNDVIVLSPKYLSNLYEWDLEKGVELVASLSENGQQVIAMHNDIFVEDNNWFVADYAEELSKKGKNIGTAFFTEDYKSPEDWNNVSVKMSARRLIKMQELDFESKVWLAKRIILKAFTLTKAQRPAVGLSFGKDSMVLFHLIDQVVREYNLPKPILCFTDTEAEFPEHIAFAEIQAERIRNMGYELYWEKPKTKFWDVIAQKGFPIFGKVIRPSSNPELIARLKRLGIKYCGNSCCGMTKTVSYINLYKEKEIDLAFSGIMASESNDRRQGYYRNYKRNISNNELNGMYGEICFIAGEGRYKATPMVHFMLDDIWTYIDKFNVSLSPVYSMGYWKTNPQTQEKKFIHYKRTGCWACAMNIAHPENNLEILRHTHPALWAELMFDKGLGMELYRFIYEITKEEYESKPELYQKRMRDALESKPDLFDLVRMDTKVDIKIKAA